MYFHPGIVKVTVNGLRLTAFPTILFEAVSLLKNGRLKVETYGVNALVICGLINFGTRSLWHY